jgi:hypothetical protein
VCGGARRGPKAATALCWRWKAATVLRVGPALGGSEPETTEQTQKKSR